MLNVKNVIDSRLRVWGGFMVAAIVFLAVGLYFFQVISSDKYVSLATKNRLRILRFSPARGEIFDRNGAPIALNETTFNIMGYPLDLYENGVIEKVARLLSRQGIETTPEMLSANIKKQQSAPYRVITLVQNLAMTQMAEVVSDPEFPQQLFPLPVWRRVYPAGASTSLITGYVGEVSEAEMRADSNYIMGDIVGKGGVERNYDDILRGIPGQEALEVDARGRRVRSLETVTAKPGAKLNLTIDLAAQREALSLLGEHGYKGAIVALDVRTGEVLVLASSPTFDNNPLAWGVSSQEWSLLMDNPDKPMFNRAIAGAYPPASTFKVLIAIAALGEGVVDTKTRIHCPGSFAIAGKTFRCWRRGGHGSMNISSALQYSCDVYFYQVGLQLGIQKILKWTSLFGIGKQTGIDIPGEFSGTAAGPDWKKNRFQQSWFPGDTVNYSIGQGYLLSTPLQLARLYATIANGGNLVYPFLAQGHSRAPTPLNLQKNDLTLVQKGLSTVVRSGTGSGAGRFAIEVAGKTGTAQNSHGPDHALFVGYAPVNNPVYVVSVMIEGGIGGGAVAAPMAGKMLAHLLK